MVFIDLPPQMQERVVCSISAAIKYEVPANIMLAVAEKEAGKSGQWVRNTNGTHDVGAMQFNTKYLSDLSRYGITANDVAAAGCYAFDLAAWRLRMHIRNDKGDIWTKAANYHSRTRKYNTIYRADLMLKAAKWADWLEACFVTLDVMKSDAVVTIPSKSVSQEVMPPAIQTPSKKLPTTKPAAIRAESFIGYVPRQISFDPNRESGK